jgi:hypothetical protein
MKHIALISLLCVAASLPPMPPMPKPVLRSPKDAASQPVVIKPAVTVAPVMRQITLAWDYPTNLIAGVQFEVWAAPTLFQGPPLTNATNVPNGFNLLIVVDQPTAVIQSNLPQQFFIVRAKYRSTGAYSPWNQSEPEGPVGLTAPKTGQILSNTITLSAVVRSPLTFPWSPGGLNVTP